MAWRCRCGSLSRSLLSSGRASTFRSSTTTTTLPRFRPPPFHGRPRSSSNIGVIGATQSLLPLHSVVVETRLTSYVAVSPRAFCELSQGT